MEIKSLYDQLSSQIQFSEDRCKLLALHSMMNSSDQREIFETLPKGIRKIILATNIAETSITIDDVVFVVDSGKVKEQAYQEAKKMKMLGKMINTILKK